MPVNYKRLQKNMLSGDVLLVEGRGIMSVLIRVLTGQNISHVAMLGWIEGGLWVLEMKEFKGFRMSSLYDWMQEQHKNFVYYGIAPACIRNKHQIIEAALMYKTTRYGYFSLIKVWYAQIRKKNFRIKAVVCSTYVQSCWINAGYNFKQTADPGDFMRLCSEVKHIR